MRDLRETIAKGDKAAAEQLYRKTVSVLDKAIQKGTLHENTAVALQVPSGRARQGDEVGCQRSRRTYPVLLFLFGQRKL